MIGHRQNVERLLTREMRADLRKLDAAKRGGFIRVDRGYRRGTDFISHARASWLIADGLACRVFGKHVRLLITSTGRFAIGAKDQPS
jgi:hypothetical protein